MSIPTQAVRALNPRHQWRRVYSGFTGRSFPLRDIGEDRTTSEAGQQIRVRPILGPVICHESGGCGAQALLSDRWLAL